MGYGLGWKNVAPQYPYVNGEPWVDGMSRSGNRISWSYNAKFVVPTATGYWNYGWYVDMQCGPTISNNRLVKPRFTAYNKRIGGVEHWQSTYNGNFTGAHNIGGKDTYTTIRMTFHDDAGNWGSAQYWNVDIPRATAPSDIISKVTYIKPNQATISGSIDKRGDYSTITKWQIECGGQTKTSTQNVTNYSATFENLASKTTYSYVVTVWNSAGFSKSYKGSFTTLQDEIGYIIKDGQPVKVIMGWVITPDGRKRRITKVKTVAPLSLDDIIFSGDV